MKKAFFLLFISISALAQSQVLQTYTNPILSGFYPDPSICKAGDDYYLVNSTFAYFPGLPLFHSKDLVNWQQIGNAMNRPEQLNLDGAGVSRGLFAPAISYDKGLFYIVCTNIDKIGNFVITAKDPKGPWSNPVPLKVPGIDPSLFFDPNGKAYLIYNSDPPDKISLYDGHRTIRMREFDRQTLQVSAEEKLLINGGTDISKKPVWIEGPHIFQKDGWYYLICAEGGTSDNHSEVVFRSKKADGPYESYANNPILTQRHLDPERANPITATGHAQFAETKDGKWYAVFLGCRPYKGSYYNTGRETFMAPVQWKGGWPVILEGKAEVQYHYPVPMSSLTKKVVNPFGGNTSFKDEFSALQLADRWLLLRTPRSDWYSLTQRKGWLAMKARPETCGGRGNPSFVAHRQQHIVCTAATALQFTPSAANEKAGLAIFQNETHFYYLCKGMDHNKPVVQLYTSTKDSSMTLLAGVDLRQNHKDLQLKIESKGSTYSFYYATRPNAWQLLKDGVDGKFLSTSVAGGFVGSVFALYATSSGGAGQATAYYDWFTYKGDDKALK